MNFINTFKNYEYLGKALKFIIDNSLSLYAPYHNLNHNITVTNYAIYCAEHENLNEEQKKELFIAAIFHDYNHSAGESPDNINIIHAKAGIARFLNTYNIGDINKQNIFDIIDATEFPYKIDESKLNIQQKIIRDCDMLQLCEPVRLQCNYLGLAKEMGISFKQVLENQKKFYAVLKFRTKFAQAFYLQCENEILKELVYLESIYNE
jgi:hypothetical protein